MARKAKKDKVKEVDPQAVYESWMINARKDDTSKEEANENFEAGSNGYITFGGCHYEQYWLKDGSGYCVVAWTNANGTIGAM